LRFPGFPNVWTQPIRNRLDMLLTGIKTPFGIKILGADLNEIQLIGRDIEGIARKIPGTPACTPNASRRATSPTIVGGMVTSTIHVLIITPVILYVLKRRTWQRGALRPSRMSF
jgi:Cu/Ag efflux pump CusA